MHVSLIIFGSFCPENLETVISYHTAHTKNLDFSVKVISQWKGQWLFTELIYSGPEPGKAQDEPEHFVILEYRETLNNNNKKRSQQTGRQKSQLEGSHSEPSWDE